MRAGDSISALTKSESFYEECKYVLTGIDFIKFKSRYPRGAVPRAFLPFSQTYSSLLFFLY
jgi:hypothetical protein